MEQATRAGRRVQEPIDVATWSRRLAEAATLSRRGGVLRRLGTTYAPLFFFRSCCCASQQRTVA
jgi:hypothetical protein